MTIAITDIVEIPDSDHTQNADSVIFENQDSETKIKSGQLKMQAAFGEVEAFRESVNSSDAQFDEQDDLLNNNRFNKIVEYKGFSSLDEIASSNAFNWTVSKVPMRDRYDGVNRLISSHRMLVRDDNRKQLTMVKSSSVPLQNSDLIDFVRPLVDSKMFSVNSAYNLDGGRNMIIALKNDHIGRFEVIPDDPMESLVFARLTRSSSPVIEFGNVTMRLVCRNGLIGRSFDSYKIDQAAGSKKALEDVQRIVETHAADIESYKEILGNMVQFKMENEDALEEFWRKSLGFPWNDPDLVFSSEEEFDKHQKAVKKNRRTVQKVFEAYAEESALIPEQYQDTMWHAYQAMTRYSSHGRSNNANNNIKSFFFGAGRKISNKSYSVAREMMAA